MQLTHELHDRFKEANGKNAICCRILTREFNMGKGEHNLVVLAGRDADDGDGRDPAR